ncbi:hypothetical protein BYT27DRAFT_7333549 [Phlegmacium glaucopus]|nr:hypothetical protein BYT27DRAFT_7333549 [Phlegmacium glaucopus]
MNDVETDTESGIHTQPDYYLCRRRVETNTDSGIHTRSQITAYAGIGPSISFRNHFFSTLILGPYARFIRWDRRGAVVTCRFDYTKHPFHIFNFYLRYGQLTLLQRGFDPTAE